MARLKRNTNTDKPFEKTHDIKKMSLFITIVNKGQGNAIVKLFEQFDCACSFIHRGEGTASESIYDLLGLQDNRKDVIFSIIKNENSEELKKEIESFFRINKKNKGIAMRIALSSVVGINVYRFLANDF